MAHEYDDENAAYEAKIREMVLVDCAPHDRFTVKFNGEDHGSFEDVGVACKVAETMAGLYRAKWDVTIQARNAADMS